ncbi:MAG: hypothetical protein U0793_11205 [Gemmataceae bacterium]
MKERGQKRWLDGGHRDGGCFPIHAALRRGCLIALLGERIVGFLISDRWSRLRRAVGAVPPGVQRI